MPSKRIDSHKYAGYRLYMPGSWPITQVLTVAAEYVDGEPIIINTPAAAGDWEIGNCSYEKYRAACSQAAVWFANPSAEPELPHDLEYCNDL